MPRLWRDGAALGSAEATAAGIQHGIREASWERIPAGDILRDGATRMWAVADAHVPRVQQALES